MSNLCSCYNLYYYWSLQKFLVAIFKLQSEELRQSAFVTPQFLYMVYNSIRHKAAR